MIVSTSGSSSAYICSLARVFAISISSFNCSSCACSDCRFTITDFSISSSASLAFSLALTETEDSALEEVFEYLECLDDLDEVVL